MQAAWLCKQPMLIKSGCTRRTARSCAARLLAARPATKVLQSHTQPGHMDLALEVLKAARAEHDSLKGTATRATPSNSRGAAATTGQPVIVLSTHCAVSRYNALRAAVYAQSFVDPIRGQTALAFTLHERSTQQPAASQDVASREQLEQQPAAIQDAEPSTTGSASPVGSEDTLSLLLWRLQRVSLSPAWQTHITCYTCAGETSWAGHSCVTRLGTHLTSTRAYSLCSCLCLALALPQPSTPVCYQAAASGSPTRLTRPASQQQPR